MRRSLLVLVAVIAVMTVALPGGAAAQSAENVTDVQTLVLEDFDSTPTGADKTGDVVTLEPGESTTIIASLEINGTGLVSFQSTCNSTDISFTNFFVDTIDLTEGAATYTIDAQAEGTGSWFISCSLNDTQFLSTGQVVVASEPTVPLGMWAVIAAVALIAMMAAVYIREQAFLASMVGAAFWALAAVLSLSVGVGPETYSVPAIGIVTGALAGVMVLVALLAYTGHWHED